MSAEAYPLQWPEGWPRTRPDARDSDNRFKGPAYGLSMERVLRQLLSELTLLGAKDIVISTNVPLRRDGLPYADQRRIDDPGAAVYFTLKKRQMVMAMDRYISVPGNLRSLTLAIEAMRQLERHGGGTMTEKAFSGFAALAPPNWKKPWREVFGVAPDWCGDVKAIYREKTKLRHPDGGGSDQLMAELNVAYDEAKRELGL